MPSALIIASTRGAADAQESLRLQDYARAVLARGFSVDVLLPRRSSLMAHALDAAARVYVVPALPFSRDLPPRPSLRRACVGFLMVLRAIALVLARRPEIVYAFNDGALVARLTDRCTVQRFAYVVDLCKPFTWKGLNRDARGGLFRWLERAAIRHAAAVVVPDGVTRDALGAALTHARVSVIPDPHAEITPDAFTVGEFTEAIGKIQDYVTR